MQARFVGCVLLQIGPGVTQDLFPVRRSEVVLRISIDPSQGYPLPAHQDNKVLEFCTFPAGKFHSGGVLGISPDPSNVASQPQETICPCAHLLATASPLIQVIFQAPPSLYCHFFSWHVSLSRMNWRCFFFI